MATYERINPLAPREKDDPTRAAIREYGYKNHLSMTQMSHKLGKNASYIHQYLQLGTPKWLNYEMSAHIHEVFGLPLDVLNWVPSETMPSARCVPIEISRRKLMTYENKQLEYENNQFGGNTIPAFADTGSLAMGAEKGRVEAPGNIGLGDDLIALWISVPATRLRAGDLAYVSRTRPARPGDTVVVDHDNKIVLMGELIAVSAEHIEVGASGKPQRFNRVTHNAWKVVGCLFT